MRKGYDFSKGVRGKFYRRGTVLNLPVYLDKEVLAFVQDIASRKNADLSTIVNQLIRNDMDQADTIS